jgi:hypothetical protein
MIKKIGVPGHFGWSFRLERDYNRNLQLRSLVQFSDPTFYFYCDSSLMDVYWDRILAASDHTFENANQGNQGIVLFENKANQGIIMQVQDCDHKHKSRGRLLSSYPLFIVY